MKARGGFQPVGVMVLLLVSVLGLLRLGLSLGQEAWMIPPPEGTAEQLVSALAARRYSGARQQLSQELRRQTEPADLQAWVQAIEAAHRGIREVHERGAHRQGERAGAQVQVKLGDQSEQTLTFELRKENGLWKVTSLEPLTALTR